MKGARRHDHSARGFAVVDGCLAIGGVPLPRLAARVGGTPFYAYDRHLITERVDLLRHHLPPTVHLSYAVKANPMPAVVQHLAGLVDGFDLASAGEMKTALDSGMPADRISFAGPGKTEQELSQAIAAGVALNLESAAELETAARIGDSLGLRPRAAVRVNPDFELKGSGMRMGGGAKPFGVDVERVPDLLRRMAELDVAFEGFHIFGGSQNLLAEQVREAQRHTVDLAFRLAERAPGPVRGLNIGGGFGIPYFPGDAPLDLAAVGEGLAGLAAEVSARLPEARLIVELGRYVVGEAGVYVCRVIDRKVSRNQTFLVTDGGLHHHLAVSGNFGQVVRRNYPVAIGNRMAAPADDTVSVVGCLCTPLDILADAVTVPRAEPGDLIVVFQSGAYGLTASPTAFLGHKAPDEVLV